MLLSLSACSTVVKEEDFYTDEGPDGAVITHFFSTKTAHIGKDAWDSMREGMTCIGPTAFGDLKLEIEELCSKVSCVEGVLDGYQPSMKDVQKQIKELRDKYEAFYSRLNSQ